MILRTLAVLIGTLLVPCLGWAQDSLVVQTSRSMGPPVQETVQTGTQPKPKATQPRPTGPLEQLVSVDIRNQSLAEALKHISTKSGVALIHGSRVIPMDKRVTLTAENKPLGEILRTILRGTDVTLEVTSSGKVMLVRRSAGDTIATTPAERIGSLTGRILDSATGTAIPGATILVIGTNSSAITDNQGGFVLRNVPVGERTITIKLFGYRATSRPITIVDGKNVLGVTRLIPTPTELSGVVTTATGLQRKIEVGNDITTINVDSVVRNMPVTTVTDLLATRVPGLDVAPTSGAPGAPSRIRIRGVGSINSTNDPIVIVDGMRMYAEQIKRSGNLALPGSTRGNTGVNEYTTVSPIDLIDVNSIETVEVMKGPSAVALYGMDAANGVILITKKRGQAGPARWNGSAALGQTSNPGSWPVRYQLFGTMEDNAFRGEIAYMCSVEETGAPRYGGSVLSGGRCRVDSVKTYQPLNNPDSSVFGRGITQTYTMGVQGGTSGLLYALSGTSFAELGLIKIPDVDVALLKAAGMPFPAWQRRPERVKAHSGNGSLTAIVGRHTIGLFTSLLYSLKEGTPFGLDAQNTAQDPIVILPGAVPSPPPLRFINWIAALRTRVSSRSLRFANNVTMDGQLRNWLRTHIQGGLDLINRKDLITLESGCLDNVGGQCAGSDSLGFYHTTHGLSTVTSAKTNANITIMRSRMLSLNTTAGVDYSRTLIDDVKRNASGIPIGATSGNIALVQFMREDVDDRIGAGMFAEFNIGIADRVWIPLSIRQDVGSGLGSAVRPTFPRLTFSYLVSDQPVFRSIPGIGRLRELRLRTAYGQSGVQPAITTKLRTYTQGNTTLDNMNGVTLNLSTIGNAALRPERSREWERGFDADMAEWLSLGVTWFNKRTRDMIVDIPVPMSVLSMAGGYPVKQSHNIGDAENSGTEITLRMDLVRRQSLQWNINSSISSLHNKLLRLGLANPLETSTEGQVFTRFAEGYPLNGQWSRPVVGYTDLNGDGVLTKGVNGSPDEYVLGDSAVFLGAPDAKFRANIHQAVTIASSVTVALVFSYEHGKTVVNRLLDDEWSRGLNDPFLPLEAQANLKSAVGTTQSVSTLRFNELSLSCNIPRKVTRRILQNRSLFISLQGTNLKLWTNYRWKDPDVNRTMGEVMQDNGVLPEPRTWRLVMRIN